MEKIYYPVKCKRCGEKNHFLPASEDNAGLGCLVLFLAPLAGLLFLSHISGRIVCARCGHIFPRPAPPSTSLSTFALSIVATLFIGFFVMFLVILSPDLLDPIADHAAFRYTEELIISNARAITGVIVPLILLIVVASIVVSCVSNYKYRSELKAEYERQTADPVSKDQGEAEEAYEPPS